MATITKRTRHGKTVYQVKVRSTAGNASATFDKLADAKDWASRTETDIRRGVHVEKQAAREHTLADAIDGYLASPAFRKITNTRGQSDRKAQVNWWRRHYGHLTLAQFDSDKIAEGRDALSSAGGARGRRVADATVNRYLAALSAVMKRTERETGWIKVNPCKSVDRFTEDNARDKVLTTEERERLLAECKPDLRDLVTLALWTAGRRGELLGLRWGDVDLKAGRVTFTDTKNGETRSVALVGPALEVLKRRSKVRRIDGDWVFPSATKPKQAAKFRGAFEGAVKRAGLGDFVFHGLRHCALTALAASGATLSQLQQIAGHRTLAMVARYKHLTEDDTRSALQRLAEMAIE